MSAGYWKYGDTESDRRVAIVIVPRRYNTDWILVDRGEILESRESFEFFGCNEVKVRHPCLNFCPEYCRAEVIGKEEMQRRLLDWRLAGRPGALKEAG